MTGFVVELGSTYKSIHFLFLSVPCQARKWLATGTSAQIRLHVNTVVVVVVVARQS